MLPFYVTVMLTHSLNVVISCLYMFGFFSTMRVTLGFVYMLEFIPKRQHAMITTVFSLQVPMLTLFSTFYFSVLTDYWFALGCVGLGFLLICDFGIIKISESPKWLLKNKRAEEAQQVLLAVAKANRVEVETQSDGLIQRVSELLLPDAGEISEVKGDKTTFIEYLKLKEVWLNLLCMALIWTSASFNTYLVLFQLKYFPGNIFINTTASAVSDVLAFTASGVVVQKLGIKWTLFGSFVMGLVGGLAIVFQTSGGKAPIGWLFPFLVLFSKFGISSAYNICYLSNSMLFPAKISATTMGICNTFARTACILAPLMAEFELPLPMIIFTALCAMASLASLFLIQK